MNQLSVIQQTKINKNEKIKELSLGLKVEIVEKINIDEDWYKRI